MPKNYEEIFRQMESEMCNFWMDTVRRLRELPHPGMGHCWSPRVDIYETDSDVVVRVEIAGVSEESLKISFSPDSHTLSIAGTREENRLDDRAKTRYHRIEIYFGSFEREIPLPSDFRFDTSGITASCRNGFLIITLPKLRTPKISRNIPITEE